MARNALFDEQRKHRLDWMHWLHDKPKHARWARDWQESHQRELSRLETVSFGKDCFVASSVHIFAEPTGHIHRRRVPHRGGGVHARTDFAG